MSAFLAPIHYWLYNKIRRVAEREELIYEKAAAMCGSTAEEIRSVVWQSYGEPLPEADLADIIDQSNIHGWLQRQITLAETREAAAVAELIRTCGQTATELVGAAFSEHGHSCGVEVRNSGKYDLDTAGGIYKALGDYFLNGMPCDQAQTVVEEKPDRLVWEGSHCLKAANWSRAGIDAAVMRGFYIKWLGAFVDGANPKFRHSLTADPASGSPVARHEIVKKSS